MCTTQVATHQPIHKHLKCQVKKHGQHVVDYAAKCVVLKLCLIYVDHLPVFLLGSPVYFGVHLCVYGGW